MKKLTTFLLASLVMVAALATVSSDSTKTGIGAGGTSVQNPAGTDWVVGYTDWTDNQVLTAGLEYNLGPYRHEYNAGGTGATNLHTNTAIDDTAFGVRQWTIGSSAGSYTSLQTDSVAITPGGATFRVGSRLQMVDIPVSGAQDYEMFVGFNSKQTNLNTVNYAMIGVDLSINATNYIVKTKDGSTENTTDTGVAFAEDVWVNLEMEMSATAITAWIDGVKVLDASTTNVPVAAASMNATPLLVLRVGSPTLTRIIYNDWSYVAFKATTARGSVGSGGPF